MATDVRVTVASAIVVVVAAATVLHRARTATVPLPERRANAYDAALIAERIREAEPKWAVAAEESFPRDAWSQNDDFHGQERDLARTVAGERHVPIADALRAIDDDLHAAKTRLRDAPDPRRTKAVPCKPRPVYD